MAKLINTILIIGIMIFLSSTSASQEITVPISVKSYSNNTNRIKTFSTGDTLTLPFIDEFSSTIGYPDLKLWSDVQVFVNNTYAKNPSSIGVASFDAINEEGSLYSNVSIYSEASDSLTSHPINLELPDDTSIYLSFLYQPGGIGETPDLSDSLVVEFYSDTTQKWYRAWSASFNKTDSTVTEYFNMQNEIKTVFGDSLYNLDEKFTYTIIPVRGELFLQKGFKFRFINYTSISSNYSIPSIIGNVDHWHIDFVILDKNRTKLDTIINDIAFTKPMESLLENYESIPWPHFQRASATEMTDTILLSYSNLSDQIWNIDRNYEIIDLMNNEDPYLFPPEVADDIDPFSDETHSRPINYIYPYDNSYDSALFQIRSYLTTDNFADRSPYRWNDTITYYQKFYNYYAYDDGSAESGYGIVGNGTKQGRVAIKFHSYESDTLQAIQVYFNQIQDSPSLSSRFFTLMVWESNDTVPGDIIYSQSGLRPVAEDSLNKFHTFKLEEKIILDRDFFIGWKKSSNDMLNIGFDLNNFNNDKVLYNFGDGWTLSGVEGSIMLRPVFGKEISLPTHIKETKPTIKFDFYPNPARDYIYFNLENADIENYTVQIINTQGQIIQDQQIYNNQLQLKNLNTGLYFLRISNSKGVAGTKKIIISQ